ncbi:60S ribosomal protein L12-like [Penaeus chinensis]|uniref:60S ribosomal protein L12-like n=1 Tax=Penaeus chinensis TaxID=139456 RepID=UPI001FB67C18|nr:60S ribosomal protein L12-like [Penaeus chinensis]
MPPKFDPEATHIVTVRCIGQRPPPTNILASKIGPLQLNPKKVCAQITKATQEWPGQKITVRITAKNRQCETEVVPSAAAYIIRTLRQPDREKIEGHRGNLAFHEVIEIGRQMAPRSMAKTFAGTVKMVLGTAQSVGCLVNGEPPHSIIEKVNAGSILVPLE